MLDATNASTGAVTTITGLEQYRRALLSLPGGLATTFQLTSGHPVVPFTQWRTALYAQDDIKLTASLSVSAGLRYAFTSNPGAYNNFGPRVSLSWALDRKQRWVLHARAGIFDVALPAIDGDEVARLRNGLQTQLLTYAANGSPAENASSIQVGTVHQFGRGFAERSTFNAVVSLQHQFGMHWEATPGVFWGEDWRVPIARNINAPLVFSSVGTVPDPTAALLAPRPFVPNLNILQYENGGHLTGNLATLSVNSHGYKALDFTFLYGHFHFKSNDAVADITLPQSTYSQLGESARVSWSDAHRISVLSTLHLPARFAFSAIFAFHTGDPFNVTTGTDNNGDGNFTDRPAFATAPGAGVYATRYGLVTTNTVNGNVPANFGTMPSIVHLDTNLSREFTLGRHTKDTARKLTLNARSTNLLNHTNVSAVGTVVSSPNFSEPVAAETARRLELGAHFAF